MVKGVQNKMFTKGKKNAMAFYDLFNDTHKDKGVQLGKLTKIQNGWSFTINPKRNTKLIYAIPSIENGTARLYRLNKKLNSIGNTGCFGNFNTCVSDVDCMYDNVCYNGCCAPTCTNDLKSCGNNGICIDGACLPNSGSEAISSSEYLKALGRNKVMKTPIKASGTYMLCLSGLNYI